MTEYELIHCFVLEPNIMVSYSNRPNSMPSRKGTGQKILAYQRVKVVADYVQANGG
jgi:hypothetical protein